MNLLLQSRGLADVVRVQARDVASARRFDADVQRCGRTAVLLAFDDTNSRVGHFFGEARRSVRGSIVDDEKFEVSERLIQNACDRFTEKLLAVVDGDEYRHFRFRIHRYPRLDRAGVYVFCFCRHMKSFVHACELGTRAGVRTKAIPRLESRVTSKPMEPTTVLTNRCKGQGVFARYRS